MTKSQRVIHIDMKKILTLILVFCSLWVSAQLSSAKVNRIQNASTAFGFNIPVGDILYDANTKRFYGIVLARTSAEKISDLTAGTHYKELTNETVLAVDDNSTNSTMYPLWTTAAGQVVPKVSTTKFTLNPSTGLISTGNYGSSADWYNAYLNIPNLTVQALSGTTVSWNCANGSNATLTLSGTTTITLSNVITGSSGNIKVTNPAGAANILNFALSGKTVLISAAVYVSSGRVSTSGAGKIDMFSWYYDGTNLIINGSLIYL